ncbi:SDR family oxidoreductase [Pseudomonas sp. RIT-PI-AD]|uniref:SDR family oxidoreductase n=1 Tax=Pseudomonas sp. RIT-PI-AD TaxID=3035294 RepID=UPI0021D93885|nr:SDR family oxidoreductase [Pseudomonas sp. RIT-PI-AD]
MARLSGKRILVTGGSAGIGLASARRFLAEGAEVAITGRDPETLARTRRLLGEALWTLPVEAGDSAAQGQLAERLGTRWARLDGAFLNAGDVTHQPLDAWCEADFDRVLATNLKGPFFLLQRLLPLFAEPASVVLCGSVSAHIGLPDSSVYAASKAALLSLARTLSAELAGRGIRVNGLSPGPTETAALGKVAPGPQATAALRERIAALVPIGRLGRPEEIAEAAVFLISDESSFMRGAEVLVDGGVRYLKR